MSKIEWRKSPEKGSTLYYGTADGQTFMGLDEADCERQQRRYDERLDALCRAHGYVKLADDEIKIKREALKTAQEWFQRLLPMDSMLFDDDHEAYADIEAALNPVKNVGRNETAFVHFGGCGQSHSACGLQLQNAGVITLSHTRVVDSTVITCPACRQKLGLDTTSRAVPTDVEGGVGDHKS